MQGLIHKEYEVHQSDYLNAGSASADIKRSLRQLGIPADVLRRVAVASLETELNLVIHSLGGKLVLDLYPDSISLIAQDVGPGIPDIALAMKEGYSTASEEAREHGWGAGMGLPNIKRNADTFEIESEVGVGTTMKMSFKLAA